jgi:multidrug resistance efflux pump
MESTTKTKETIVLRHDEVQDIMSAMPRWMERRGITIIALLLLLLLGLGAIIRYPDVISGRMSLLAQQSPVRLLAKAPGRLEQLLVTDGQLVKTGTVLAVIANTGRYEDILRLETLFSRADSNNQAGAAVALPPNLQLGDAQQWYAAYLQSYQAYQYALRQPITQRKNNNLGGQLSQAGSLQQSVLQKKQLLASELELEKKALERQEQLYAESVISKNELEVQQKLFLQKQKEYQSVVNESISSAMQQQQLRGQIIVNTGLQSDNTSDRYLRLMENAALLRQAIVDWRAKYVVTAPMEGTVLFTKNRSLNQYITAQEELFTVVPLTSGNIMGQLRVAPAGAGKIAVGQTVNIYLDNYPANEFGLLKGKVKTIAPVPEGGLYPVEILVESALVTTYEKKIPYTPELGGMANIITTDRTILQRIFHNFTKTWQ